MVGRRFEAVCGPVGHGGFVVARSPEDRVVFVRHALPGERVVVALTEGRESDRFWRGDAVEILEAAADRVPAPCPYAGPGGCGGCDFQHVGAAGQRALKTAVVREQLRRLAGLDSDVEVAEVEGGQVGWRTRMRYVDLGDGRHGLRRHRSHDTVAVDRCLIATEEAQPGAAGPDVRVESVTAAGRTRHYAVAADGFWQPHVEAPRLLVETVLDLARVRPGERVLDLYAGVGLFAGFLLDETGPDGTVTVVEGDTTAARLAAENLGQETVAADVQEWLESDDAPGSADVVVLDPPRVGAKARVVAGIARLRPRAVVYVACDPAALARDLALFAGHGYRPAALRAFDLFPMTHHVECVALLVA